MRHLSTTEARKNFSNIVNEVKYQQLIVSVGRRGVSEVFIVPAYQIVEDVPVSEMNAASKSFDFLENEPEIYTLKDLKKRYV